MANTHGGHWVEHAMQQSAASVDMLMYELMRKIPHWERAGAVVEFHDGALCDTVTLTVPDTFPLVLCEH